MKKILVLLLCLIALYGFKNSVWKYANIVQIGEAYTSYDFEKDAPKYTESNDTFMVISKRGIDKYDMKKFFLAKRAKTFRIYKVIFTKDSVIDARFSGSNLILLDVLPKKPKKDLMLKPYTYTFSTQGKDVTFKMKPSDVMYDPGNIEDVDYE